MEVIFQTGATPRLTIGLHDVVTADGVRKNIPIECVMVRTSSDLANLPEYPAGTVAYTPGFSNIWQLNTAGTWVEMG